MRHRIWVVLFLSLVCVGLGCSGSRRAPVSGTVTIAKKPPGTNGIIISFVGSDNLAVTAEVGSDGSFQASGVLVGENKVCLNHNVGPGGARNPDAALADGGDDAEKIRSIKKKIESEMKTVVKTSLVPTRYNDPSQSGLKFVVEPTSNVYNIDVKN